MQARLWRPLNRQQHTASYPFFHNEASTHLPHKRQQACVLLCLITTCTLMVLLLLLLLLEQQPGHARLKPFDQPLIPPPQGLTHALLAACMATAACLKTSVATIPAAAVVDVCTCSCGSSSCTPPTMQTIAVETPLRHTSRLLCGCSSSPAQRVCLCQCRLVLQAELVGCVARVCCGCLCRAGVGLYRDQLLAELLGLAEQGGDVALLQQQQKDKGSRRQTRWMR